jgi:subtilisin family serine protease
LTALHRSLGTMVHRSYPALGRLQTVQLRPGAALTNMLARFRQSGLVEYAEPDYLVRALATPNDQYFALPDNDPGTVDQWGLHNAGQDGGNVGADIDAPEAWNIRTTAENVIVAVIDTGVRYTHEELAPNMWTNPNEIPGNGIDDDGNSYVDDVYGIDALACTGDPWDYHGHGTHVAGIIGARGNNGVGIAGVAWQVQIMACGFLDANAQGYISDAIESIDYARINGAKIINASWGDYFTGPFNGILPDFQGNVANSRALHDAIAGARSAGIIFVAATGNDGTDNDQHPLYPASYSVDNQHGEEYLPALDNIIGVAASDRNDERALFSNYGASSVHLAAPGAITISCYGGTDDSYAVFHGTSMAAAYVSGACALVWAQYPAESYQQIIHRVLMSADSIPSMAGKSRTSGRLNLHQALTVVPATSPPTGSMLTKRYGHTATLLANGKVLVAGGLNSANGHLGSVELYDPVTGTWAATTNLMTTARSFHSAVLLNNGTVLVTGGQDANGYLASAERYDPATGVWTATTNSIATARAHHTATLLPNGKVLVAGGWNSASGELLSTELFIP